MWRCKCGALKRTTKPAACEGCINCGTGLTNTGKFTKPWKHKFEEITVEPDEGINSPPLTLTMCIRCALPFEN